MVGDTELQPYCCRLAALGCSPGAWGCSLVARVSNLNPNPNQVGLFGDFCERVGHGKFVEWQPDEEHGGLYALKVVTKVRAVSAR